MNPKEVSILAGRQRSDSAWCDSPTEIRGEWVDVPACAIKFEVNVANMSTGLDGRVAAAIEVQWEARMPTGDIVKLGDAVVISNRGVRREAEARIPSRGVARVIVRLRNMDPDHQEVVFAQMSIRGGVVPSQVCEPS